MAQLSIAIQNYNEDVANESVTDDQGIAEMTRKLIFQYFEQGLDNICIRVAVVF